MPVYSVWNGRYNKLVVARSFQEAIKKSKYADCDHIEKIANNMKEFNRKFKRR